MQEYNDYIKLTRDYLKHYNSFLASAAFFGTYKREGQDGLMEAIKAHIQEYGGGV